MIKKYVTSFQNYHIDLSAMSLKYRWIHLDKLYKLCNGMFFFQISESFFELTSIFKNNSDIGSCMCGVGGICFFVFILLVLTNHHIEARYICGNKLVIQSIYT